MKKIILLFSFIILQIFLFHHVLTLAKTPENYLKGKFYNSVKNHFLVSTEKIQDDKFEKTVIAMLGSNKDGAWGLVINKPIGSLPIALLIDSALSTSEKREELYAINIEVFWGGPVNVKEIFILHSNEYKSASTKKYGNLSVSHDYNILFDIAINNGPEQSLVILGYSGWGSGQLEGEMERGRWILSNFELDIVFDKKSQTKWSIAYKNSFMKI